MPLIKSGGQKAFKSNVSTLMHEVGKSPHVQSRKQALAIAYATARRAGHKAFGGPNLNFENMVLRGSSYNLRHEGMINSSIPGRTDKLPMKVPAGSYVLPADIPSALGQGNSAAGGQILKHMFSSGPYGLGTMHGGSRVTPPRLNLRPPSMGRMGGMGAMGGMGKPMTGGFAKGGDADGHVPIVAAGGEFIIHPAVVRSLGNGSLKTGHRVLDQFVLHTRKKHIETLKKLPGPKK